MNDILEDDLKKKTPFMLKIFLFLLIILFPVLTFFSLYIDISYIGGEKENSIFNIAVLSRSFIKIAIAIYGVIVAVIFSRKKEMKFFSINTYLFVALFSPWMGEIPFFVLSVYSKSPFHIIKEVWVNFAMATVFFMIWFSYFNFSKYHRGGTH